MIVKMWCIVMAWLHGPLKFPSRRNDRATFGADSTYARDLHLMARTDGYLTEEERVNALANARRDLYDHSKLDGIERAVYQSLDAMWARVCEQLHLDPVDQEFIALSVSAIGGRELALVHV